MYVGEKCNEKRNVMMRDISREKKNRRIHPRRKNHDSGVIHVKASIFVLTLGF